MTSDSNSDSDIEFLAELQRKRLSSRSPKRGAQHKPANQASGTENSSAKTTGDADLTRVYWEKLGENNILRTQLNKTQAEHQRHLAEILEKQSRDRDEHKRELDEMKRSLERERIQRQFLLAELRLKNSNASSVAEERELPSKDTVHKTRPSAAYSDGFVLKKPRIIPPSSSFSAAFPGTLPSPANLHTAPANPIASQSDMSQLMAFLVNHQAPNFEEASLQLLFGHRTAGLSPNTPSSGAPASIGQDLTLSLSLGEFADKTVRYIENLSEPLSSDCVELLLSVLYDSLFLDLPWSSQQSRISKRLCNLLVFWVKEYQPLPKFTDFEEDNTIRIVHARRLTCITYTLDVLLAADWEFEISYDMCRRVMALGHAPHLCSRIIELMALHPQTEFTALITFQFPMVPAEPSPELLFSGLPDKPSLSAVQFSRRAVPRSKICSFVLALDDIEELKDTASRLAGTFFERMQVASIRLADALVRKCTSSPSIDQHVLGLLTRSVDSFALHPNSELVKLSVFYLWCRGYAALRQNLDAGSLTELCVCLAKLVHDCADDASDVVEQARQLLQVLTSSEELDKLLEVFEALESESMDDEDPDLMIDS